MAFLRLFMVFIIGATMSPGAWGQKVPQASGENRVYYYSGAMKVELDFALDELHVETTGSLDQRNMKAALGPDAIVTSEEVPGKGFVKFARQPGISELEQKASGLVKRGFAARAQPVLYISETKRTAVSRQVPTGNISVKLRPGAQPGPLLSKYNLRMKQKIHYSPDTYILETLGPGLLTPLHTANALVEKENVEFATPETARPRVPRLTPNDTLYNQQWHLKNTGSNAVGAVAGNDVNPEPAWDTVTGAGVNIAISDDGLQHAHPDLQPNARTDIDIDIVGGDLDPSPSGTNNHGTACAGVAAARGNNALGVSGAAMHAGLVGVRVLGSSMTDTDEAQALQHQATAVIDADRVHINSNSWGPSDDAARLETWGPLAKAAVEYAIANGRGGNGTIFTWAAGNGLGSNDNVNYDGYASSRYTIAVGATGAAGQQAYYSEPGASMLINTPSNYVSGSTGITTTDRTGGQGYVAGDYTSGFGGTSSACPLAAGCIALILDANANLTWRDVQHVLVSTATKNLPGDAGWFTNGAGRWFNHKFGFGRIDVSAAVTAALSWTNVPSSHTPLTNSESGLSVAIPDNNATGIERTLAISGPSDFVVEHVEVTVNITHPYRGDLAISLQSPDGSTALLSTVHNDAGDNYSNWLFTSVVHWGEDPNGNWTLKVADGAAADVGTLAAWSITVHGYSPTVTPVTMSAFTID